MPCLRRTVISPRKKEKEKKAALHLSPAALREATDTFQALLLQKAFLASKLQFTDTPSCLNTIYEGISCSSKLNSDVPDGKSSS